MTEGADIKLHLADLLRPIDVLILDDTITPFPDMSVENTLWELIYLASTRTPPVRTLLVMHEEPFPLQIRDPLASVARENDGSTHILSRDAGLREQAEAVQWLTSQLNLGRTRQQAWIMPLSGAGGVGKSTQMANLALATRHKTMRR